MNVVDWVFGRLSGGSIGVGSFVSCMVVVEGMCWGECCLVNVFEVGGLYWCCGFFVVGVWGLGLFGLVGFVGVWEVFEGFGKLGCSEVLMKKVIGGWGLGGVGCWDWLLW